VLKVNQQYLDYLEKPESWKNQAGSWTVSRNGWDGKSIGYLKVRTKAGRAMQCLWWVHIQRRWNGLGPKRQGMLNLGFYALGNGKSSGIVK
jgi:hypothetical protein